MNPQESEAFYMMTVALWITFVFIVAICVGVRSYFGRHVLNHPLQATPMPEDLITPTAHERFVRHLNEGEAPAQ